MHTVQTNESFIFVKEIFVLVLALSKKLSCALLRPVPQTISMELDGEVVELQRELADVLRQLPAGERAQAIGKVRGVLDKLRSRPTGDGDTTDDEGGAADGGGDAAPAAVPQPAQPAAVGAGGAPPTMEYDDADREQEDDTQVGAAAPGVSQRQPASSALVF